MSAKHEAARARIMSAAAAYCANKVAASRVDPATHDPIGQEPHLLVIPSFAELDEVIGAELRAASEMEDALRCLLDMWHGGHLQVRPEASGAWHAVVQAGEDAIAKATGGQA